MDALKQGKEGGIIMTLTRYEIESIVKMLLKKYHADYAILFGSYARGDATEDSDIDIIVFGGENFSAINIFAFGEDMREITKKNVDAFEIREVNQDSEFYRRIMSEGVKIA